MSTLHVFKKQINLVLTPNEFLYKHCFKCLLILLLTFALTDLLFLSLILVADDFLPRLFNSALFDYFIDTLKRIPKGDLRYSTGGLGVRWVVAIDSTRVRVPAGALFLLYSVFLSYFMENTIG